MHEVLGYHLQEPSFLKLSNFIGAGYLYSHFKIRNPGNKRIEEIAQASHSGQWRWSLSPEPGTGLGQSLALSLPFSPHESRRGPLPDPGSSQCFEEL